MYAAANVCEETRACYVMFDPPMLILILVKEMKKNLTHKLEDWRKDLKSGKRQDPKKQDQVHQELHNSLEKEAAKYEAQLLELERLVENRGASRK